MASFINPELEEDMLFDKSGEIAEKYAFLGDFDVYSEREEIRTAMQYFLFNFYGFDLDIMREKTEILDYGVGASDSFLIMMSTWVLARHKLLDIQILKDMIADYTVKFLNNLEIEFPKDLIIDDEVIDIFSIMRKVKNQDISEEWIEKLEKYDIETDDAFSLVRDILNPFSFIINHTEDLKFEAEQCAFLIDSLSRDKEINPHKLINDILWTIRKTVPKAQERYIQMQEKATYRLLEKNLEQLISELKTKTVKYLKNDPSEEIGAELNAIVGRLEVLQQYARTLYLK